MKRWLKTIVLIGVFFAVAACLYAQADNDSAPTVKLQPLDEQPSEETTDNQPPIAEKFTHTDHLITVTTQVNRAKIQIGDSIIYRIEAEAAENVQITFPEFGEFLGGFAITDFQQDGPVKTGRFQRWARQYTLDVYVSEHYVIPPARITYQLANGDQQQLFTQPIFVAVDSVLTGDDAGIRDIKPVQAPAVRARTKLVITAIIGVFLCAVAVLAVVLWVRKRRQHVEPSLPAHIIALHALQELRHRGLVENGQFKEYYFLVSNILRHYIERRFGLMAPERTTEEFLVEMQKTALLDTSHKSVLHSFLVHCDMVKFAQYAPSDTEIEQIYSTAIQFIMDTKVPDNEEQDEEEDDE